MQGGLSIQIESWAEENDVPVERYFPRYDVNGEQSRMVRDRQLIDNSTILLVVWDGRDASCKALIDAASESGLKCLQLNPLSDKKAIKSKKITLSEIRVLKDKAAKNSGMMSIPSEIILLLIDAIERRDFVLKKLSGK